MYANVCKVMAAKCLRVMCSTFQTTYLPIFPHSLRPRHSCAVLLKQGGSVYRKQLWLGCVFDLLWPCVRLKPRVDDVIWGDVPMSTDDETSEAITVTQAPPHTCGSLTPAFHTPRAARVNECTLTPGDSPSFIPQSLQALARRLYPVTCAELSQHCREDHRHRLHEISRFVTRDNSSLSLFIRFCLFIYCLFLWVDERRNRTVYIPSLPYSKGI